MQKFFTRSSRKLSLFALLLVVASMVSVLAPPKAVYADNPKPTLPLTWTDVNHTRAVSANNIPFRPLGYLCVDGGKWFHNSGKNIEIASEAQPQDDEDKIFVQSWIEGSKPPVFTSEYIENEWCVKSSKDHMPSYAWVTSFPEGTNYALIILPCYGSGEKNANKPVDPKDVWVSKEITKQVEKGNCIFFSPIGGDGKAGIDKNMATVDEIKVDPTKQGGTGVGLDAPEDVCPIKFWKLSWAVCPIATALYGEDGDGGLIGLLQDWVISHLTLNITAIFESDQYYVAWNSFRIIAISLIIVAGLIMVISQAAGLEILNAYTIRQLLPRLLLVAIAISVSWWLLEYIAQFFNNLMVWVGAAIEAPFGAKIEPLGARAMMTQMAAVIIGGTLLNPGMIISYLLTFSVVYAIASLALAVRELIIIFLIITSPIFLFFAIFQNTEGIFKTARSALIGLMAVGVVFGALMELGHVMAQLTPAKSDPIGILRMGFQIAALLAFPVILMRLGGIMAALSTAFRKRSSGFFKGQSEKRSENLAGTLASMRTGTRYTDRNMVTRAFNKTTKGVMDSNPHGIVRRIRDPKSFLEVRRATADASTRQAAQAIMELPGFMSLSQDDDSLRAAAYTPNNAVANLVRDFTAEGRYAGKADQAERIEADAKRAVSQVQAANLPMGTQALQVAAAQQLVLTGTGYKNQQQMVETFARAARGNVSTGAALAGWADFESRNAGRADLAPGAGILIELTTSRITGSGPTADDYLTAGSEAMMRADGYTATQMKGPGIKNGMANLAADIQRQQNIVNSSTAAAAARDAAKERLGQLTRKADNLMDNKMFGSENNILGIQQGLEPAVVAMNDTRIQSQPLSQVSNVNRTRKTDVNGNVTWTDVRDPKNRSLDHGRSHNIPNADYDARIAQGYNDAGGNQPRRGQ